MSQIEPEKALIRDKYHSAKALGVITEFLGERGGMFRGLYGYLKWVDNFIDENPKTPIETKRVFLLRQKSLFNFDGQESDSELTPEERGLLQLPWKYYSQENQTLIKQMALNILETNSIDLDHMNLTAKEEEEIYEYGDVLLTSCIRLASVIVNQKDLNLSDDNFRSLMQSWFVLASLRDLVEDVDTGLIHIPMTKDEVGNINYVTVESRRAKIESILNKDRLTHIKRENLFKLLKHSLAFMETDMPWWQKASCTLYNFQGAVDHGLFKKIPNLSPLTAR
jgi:hypothetical protein